MTDDFVTKYGADDRAWFNQNVPMSPRKQELQTVLAQTYAIARERVDRRKICELHPVEVDFVADCQRVVRERKEAKRHRLAVMEHRRRERITEAFIWSIAGMAFVALMLWGIA